MSHSFTLEKIMELKELFDAPEIKEPGWDPVSRVQVENWIKELEENYGPEPCELKEFFIKELETILKNGKGITAGAHVCICEEMPEIIPETEEKTNER